MAIITDTLLLLLVPSLHTAVTIEEVITHVHVAIIEYSYYTHCCYY